jgi:hypothetical protein
VKFLGLVLLLSLAAAPFVKADTVFQVNTGYIEVNTVNGLGSWSFSGGGFSITGSGEAGFCGISFVATGPITPCGTNSGTGVGQLAITGGSTLNGTQSLSFDGLWGVNGLTSFYADGSNVFTYTAPITFVGNPVACFPLCFAPGGINDFFNLNGDAGYLTMVLTKFDDGLGNVYYEKTSEIYTITGPAPSVVTPEPGALGLLFTGLVAVVLLRKRSTLQMKQLD